MAELNIKQEIGRRISDARKTKGLTLKALGKLAGDLKQSRITNWEKGTRAPGPEEIKQLALALDVSPAYLMCLADTKSEQSNRQLDKIVSLPILDYEQAGLPKESLLTMMDELSIDEKYDFVAINPNLLHALDKFTIAIKVKDNSMAPDICLHDIIIAAHKPSLNPGDYVVAKLENSNEVIIRKYKQLSSANGSSEYQLAALNDDWADLRITKDENCQIIGTVIQIVRNL